MTTKKLRTKKRTPKEIRESIERSLAEKQAGQVFGPFETAEEAMQFLQDYQRLVLLTEKMLREAARLGKQYDPEKLCWLLDVDAVVLDRKLRGAGL